MNTTEVHWDGSPGRNRISARLAKMVKTELGDDVAVGADRAYKDVDLSEDVPGGPFAVKTWRDYKALQEAVGAAAYTEKKAKEEEAKRREAEADEITAANLQKQLDILKKRMEARGQ